MMAFRQALRIHLAALSAVRSDFEDTLALIARHFEYAPTAFDNGPITNAAGENEGACRILALAQSAGLTEQETLSCFGRHYSAVIDDPGGSNHGNIRQFISTGWSGIQFDGQPLRLRQQEVSEENAASKAAPSTQPNLSINHGDAS
jgi:hypothetical protein